MFRAIISPILRSTKSPTRNELKTRRPMW